MSEIRQQDSDSDSDDSFPQLRQVPTESELEADYQLTLAAIAKFPPTKFVPSPEKITIAGKLREFKFDFEKMQPIPQLPPKIPESPESQILFESEMHPIPRRSLLADIANRLQDIDDKIASNI